jgi:hypothetical protein
MNQSYIAHHAKSANEKVMPETSICTYCRGALKDGRIKLERHGVTLYGIGNVFKVTSSRVIEGERKVTLRSTPMKITPFFIPRGLHEERRIACIEKKSGKEFRFIRVMFRGRRK